MAIDKATRLKVEAELRMGKKPVDLSKKYNVPYSAVSNWRQQMNNSISNEDVDKLLQVDDVTLHHVANEVKEKIGDPDLPEAKKVTKLVRQVNGLKRLEDKTRELSFSILNQVEKYMTLNPDSNLKDLKEATTIVTTIHNAMFNKSNTQINVLNNNNISTEKREIFKSSLKA